MAQWFLGYCVKRSSWINISRKRIVFAFLLSRFVLQSAVYHPSFHTSLGWWSHAAWWMTCIVLFSLGSALQCGVASFGSLQRKLTDLTVSTQLLRYVLNHRSDLLGFPAIFYQNETEQGELISFDNVSENVRSSENWGMLALMGTKKAMTKAWLKSCRALQPLSSKVLLTTTAWEQWSDAAEMGNAFSCPFVQIFFTNSNVCSLIIIKKCLSPSVPLHENLLCKIMLIMESPPGPRTVTDVFLFCLYLAGVVLLISQCSLCWKTWPAVLKVRPLGKIISTCIWEKKILTWPWRGYEVIICTSWFDTRDCGQSNRFLMRICGGLLIWCISWLTAG